MGVEEAWTYVGIGVVLVPYFPVVVVILVRTRRRHRDWVTVEGTVTSVKTRRQANGETKTAVRYRYVDAAGQQRSGTDTPFLRAPRRKSRITVVYDPGDPERSEASSMTWLYVLLPVTAVVMGVGLWLVVAGCRGLVS